MKNEIGLRAQEMGSRRWLRAARSLGSSIVLLLAACGATNGDDPQHLGTALLGTWTSKDCEQAGPSLSRRRTYLFSAAGADITYDLYAGAACQGGPKVMTVETRGNATFVEPSPKVPGATDVIFTFTSRAIKPTAAGVNALTQACGQYAWMPDVEVDITKDGCGSLVQGDTECPVEYDLAELSANVAYFGDRSHPLCSVDTRPTMLAQWGVVKQP